MRISPIVGLLCALSSTHAACDVVDPEYYIQKNGHQYSRKGDDGKTSFYSSTERATASRIGDLEKEIEALPKNAQVFKVCDSMRGGVKAKIIQEKGISMDVAATNYGFSGSTIACVLKYMHENTVGTQLIFSKKGAGGVYMVFVTN